MNSAALTNPAGKMGTPEVISVKEASEEKGCVRQTIYNAMGRGDLTEVKAGTHRLILRDEKYEAFRVQEKFRQLHRDES